MLDGVINGLLFGSKRQYSKISQKKRLESAEKCRTESVLSLDICGMYEIGGATRCHSLKTHASLRD